MAPCLELSVFLSSFWQCGELSLGGVKHPWPVNNQVSSLQFMDVECPAESSFSFPLLHYFYVHECFAWMYDCASCSCFVPDENRIGCGIPGNGATVCCQLPCEGSQWNLRPWKISQGTYLLSHLSRYLLFIFESLFTCWVWKSMPLTQDLGCRDRWTSVGSKAAWCTE